MTDKKGHFVVGNITVELGLTSEAIPILDRLINLLAPSQGETNLEAFGLAVSLLDHVKAKSAPASVGDFPELLEKATDAAEKEMYRLDQDPEGPDCYRRLGMSEYRSIADAVLKAVDLPQFIALRDRFEGGAGPIRSRGHRIDTKADL